MLPIPDSTRLKPLLALSIAGPLLLVIVLTQIQSRSLRKQSERTTVRRLRAIAQTVEEHFTARPDQAEAARETAARLNSLSDSLFVRLQIVDLTDSPQLLYDSRLESEDIDWSGSQSQTANSQIAIDGNLKELFLARTTVSGDDRRRINGVWQSFVAVRLDDVEKRTVILRVSSPTYSSPGDRTLDGVVAWFAVFVLIAVLAGAIVVLCRQSQLALSRLSATHRSIRRVSERDESHPAVEAKLPVLVDAYAEIARQLDLLVSGHRSRVSELEQATQFLETVLEAMVEGVVVVDREHRVAFANQAASELLAFDSAPTGRPVLEVIRNPVVDQALKQIGEGHDRIQTEFTLRGEQRTLELFATQLRGSVSGGAMLVLQDVTDLRHLENIRKEFVSNVSHELKTPLAGIQAYAETLLSGAIDDPEACQRFVTRIQEQGNRLHDLVQDLLQLGRIEAGQEAFQLERVSVAETIQATVESQQPVATGKEISIELQSPSTDLFVRVDRKGLQTILDNLVGNAVKYTPESGQVRIQWSSSKNEVQIDVTDSGVGIASEHLPRIFERFYRVDEARSRDIGGTGLGLSIVKHLVNEFRGSIDVQSTPGQGSTFTVRLPVA